MEKNNFKILVVDDEPDIVEFIAYNLKKEGYDVCTANDGLDGIKIAEKEKPDLIILDIMMPRLDGVETCEHLRRNPMFKNTLISDFSRRLVMSNQKLKDWMPELMII